VAGDRRISDACHSRRVGRNQRECKEKRQRRRAEQRWTARFYEGPPTGPDVVTPSFQQVIAALETMPQELTWEQIGPEVVPLFQRIRPYHPEMPEQLRVVVPPGLTVGFGVDVGRRSSRSAPRWPRNGACRPTVSWSGPWPTSRHAWRTCGRTTSTTAASATCRSGCCSHQPGRPRPTFSCRQPSGGFSERIASSSSHRCATCCSRCSAHRDFAAWLFDEIASQDPNCLAPAAFVIGDGQLALEPLGESYGAA
jgi:hypothetical protein